MSKLLQWSQPMLAGKTHITVALSGGADSVCCLHFLLEMSKNMGFTVGAAHFHHQIRGAEADRDAEFCKALCRQWNVPLALGTGDVPARARQNKEGLEQAARIMRYHFFGKIGGVIATAHIADDNLETVLTNLIRGTGLRGLCGIPPVRNQFIRPILPLTKGEVLTYLAEHDLPHVEDSTNQETATLRNRLRLDIIPRMEQEMPNLREKTMEMTARLREDEAFLSSLALAHFQRATTEEGLDIPTLKQAPRPIFHRCLLLFLNQLGVQQVSSAHVSGLERLILGENSSGILHLPKATVVRQYDKLLAENPPVVTFSAQRLNLPFVVNLPEIGTFCCSETRGKPGALAISQNKITPELTVRPRQIGDQLTLAGGTKTVKKRMIDMKIPAHLRDGLPVLEWNGQVIAVWKLGVAQGFAPEPGEKAWYFYFQ